MHMRFWGATLARNLPAALEIYADILRRPHLPEDELHLFSRWRCKTFKGWKTNPQKVLIELRKLHYPPPLGHDRRARPEASRA